METGFFILLESESGLGGSQARSRNKSPAAEENSIINYYWWIVMINELEKKLRCFAPPGRSVCDGRRLRKGQASPGKETEGSAEVGAGAGAGGLEPARSGGVADVACIAEFLL